jgi:intracellular septation protein A
MEAVRMICFPRWVIFAVIGLLSLSVAAALLQAVLMAHQMRPRKSRKEPA